MPYVPIDVGFFRDPKVAAVSREARELYLACLLHCGEQLTNGRVTAENWARTARELDVKRPTARKRELLENGLIIGEPNGAFSIPTYLNHNRSKEQVMEQRKRDRERQNRLRSRRDNEESNAVSNGVSHAVTETPVTPLVTEPEVRSQKTEVIPSSSSDLQGAANQPADEKLSTAFGIWATHKLAGQAPGSVSAERAWLKVVTDDLWANHAERARRLVAQRPEVSAEYLAELLETTRATPADDTVAAQAARYGFDDRVQVNGKRRVSEPFEEPF